ncbi:hypothetical protein GOV11_04590, partial [Candidatus Woesearchaeota archaeon]|nr:hypothetical protein [Candidatus Woesearchaeota archaeon]
MVLFNHLFGNSKNLAKELIMDDNKRLVLWKKLMHDYEEREKLSKHFNHHNVETALKDFEATEKVLAKIEALIPQDLVTIDDEEKTDEEILADLKSVKIRNDIENLSFTIRDAKEKQAHIIELFHEILRVLKTELKIIRIIRKNPPNIRDLMLQLFELIYRREEYLYMIFQKRYYYEESYHIHDYVTKIANAILLEEKIEEEKETDAEKFAREMESEMMKHMSSYESEHEYRVLGEEIFLKLAEMSGAPSTDILKGINRMEAFMAKDELMSKLISK